MGSTNVSQWIPWPEQQWPTRVASDARQLEVTPPEHVEVQLADQLHFDYEGTLDQILSLSQWRGHSASNSHEILCRRHGLISGRIDTLETIGSDLGISRERVRQIQQRALSHIRRRIHSVELHHSFICLVEYEIASEPAPSQRKMC